MSENKSQSSDVLLKVQGLKKYFNVGSAFRKANQKYLKAVDDINFEIKRGETFKNIRGITFIENGKIIRTPDQKIIDLKKSTASLIPP